MLSSTEYITEKFGLKNSDSYRVFFKKVLPSSEWASIYVSPFHDVPLYSEAGSNVYRMIVECPRWSNAKYEICKSEPFNPIAQSVQNGQLRYQENVFPYHGFIWNYGCLPQTWEMPSYENPNFEGVEGDNEPIDVIEIGSKIHPSGTILDIKVLGCLGLLDEGKLDWKIVAIDVTDALAPRIDDIVDIEQFMPGILSATLDWFRLYKMPEENKAVEIANFDRFFNKLGAYEVIELSHKFWTNLIKNELFFRQSKDCANFKLFNTQCQFSLDDYQKNSQQANDIVNEHKENINQRPAESIAKQLDQASVEKVFYLNKLNVLEELGVSPRKFVQTRIETLTESKSDESSLWNLIKKNKTEIMLPISLSAFFGFLFYWKYHKI